MKQFLDSLKIIVIIVASTWSIVGFGAYVRDSFPDDCRGLDSNACSNLAREMRKKLQGNNPKSFGVFRDACDMGNPEICVWLAYHVQRKQTAYEKRWEEIVDKDKINLLETNCQRKDSEACFMAGIAFYVGLGTSTSFSRASELFNRACEGGEGDACVWLGLSYQRGIGVNKSIDRAIALFSKACKTEVSAGCEMLAILFNESSSAQSDFSVRNQLLSKACELENGGACGWLGALYHMGQHVERSYSKANPLLKKACDLGDYGSCALLGRSYEFGRGVGISLQRANELYVKSCEHGYERGCDEQKRFVSELFGSPSKYLLFQNWKSVIASMSPILGLYSFFYHVTSIEGP